MTATSLSPHNVASAPGRARLQASNEMTVSEDAPTRFQPRLPGVHPAVADPIDSRDRLATTPTCDRPDFFVSQSSSPPTTDHGSGSYFPWWLVVLVLLVGCASSHTAVLTSANENDGLERAYELKCLRIVAVAPCKATQAELRDWKETLARAASAAKRGGSIPTFKELLAAHRKTTKRLLGGVK